MIYVCYIDILFLVNWMMNMVILLLTGKFLKRQIHLKYLGIGAALGAAWECFSVGFIARFSWEVDIIRFILQGMDWICIPMSMVSVSYPDKQWRERLRGCLWLYGTAFLLGGIIHAIWENTGFSEFWQAWMSGSDVEAISIWLLSLSMFSGITAIELGRYYRKLTSKRELIQEVVLYAGDRQWTVKALWDSGNHLRDPYSGKAVHIVEGKELKSLLGEGYQCLLSYMEQGVTMVDPQDYSFGSGETGQQSTSISYFSRMRLIPCRSLGSGHTLLPTFPITKILLADGSMLMEPLVGLSPISLSEDGNYGMLLHSQTDEMRRNQ